MRRRSPGLFPLDRRAARAERQVAEESDRGRFAGPERQVSERRGRTLSARAAVSEESDSQTPVHRQRQVRRAKRQVSTRASPPTCNIDAS